MLQTVRQTIERRRLLRRGDHVLLAVSGGADSAALTYALQYLGRSRRLTLTLAHLNHRLRGRRADEDARFVSELAWRLGLPCIQAQEDVRRWARRSGISIEMAAREARYDFLAREAGDLGANVIATAHTADDQVETILLKLARGAGPQGLGGIPYAVEWDGLRVVRPMLDVTHRQAVGFLRDHRLKWREDETNDDLHFLRNRVRHEILPLLESRLNPRLRAAILRTGELMRAENEWLDAVAARLLKQCLEDPRAGKLRVDKLARLPLGARRRVLRAWLVAGGLEPEHVDFGVVDSVERLVQGERGTRAVAVGGARKVVRRYRSLSLERAASGRPGVFRAPLMIPGETILPEQQLRVVTRWDKGVIRQAGVRVGDLPAEASFDARAIGRSAVCVRSWKPGDRIRPLGLSGSKKLQDVFVDHKVPRDRRHLVPVLECRGEVLWVPGYRVARGWEVRNPAGPCLHVFLRAL